MAENTKIEPVEGEFRECQHCKDWPEGDCPYCRGSGDQDYAEEFEASIAASYLGGGNVVDKDEVRL